MSNIDNDSGNRFLVGLAMAGIVIVSLIGGFKFATRNEKVDQKFNEVGTKAADYANDTWGIKAPEIDIKLPEVDLNHPIREDNENNEEDVDEAIRKDANFAYTIPEKRSYDGPKVYAVDKYLYNSEGKVDDEFAENATYALHFSANVDRSAGVLRTDDQKLYYVTGDLEKELIAENVYEAGMCFDGGYFYYLMANKDNSLYVYNVETKEATKMDGGVVGDVAISPNGKTLAYKYYSSNWSGVVIKSIDGQVLGTIEDDFYLHAVAVPNDGSALFYYTYSNQEGKEGVFCHTADGENQLSDEYLYRAYFDRECKQMVFDSDEKTCYFKVGDKKPRKLRSSSFYYYSVCNAAYTNIDEYDYYHIIDTDSLANSLMLSNYQSIFCLYGNDPQLVKFETTGGEYMYITEDGPSAVIKEYNPASLKKVSYDGKDITTEDYMTGLFSVGAFTLDKELTQAWASDYRNKALMYQNGEGTPVKVADIEQNVNFMAWNPVDNKCYYVCDGVLNRVGDSADSVEFLRDDVKSLSATGEDRSVLKIRTNDDKYFLILGDYYYEVQY